MATKSLRPGMICERVSSAAPWGGRVEWVRAGAGSCAGAGVLVASGGRSSGKRQGQTPLQIHGCVQYGKAGPPFRLRVSRATPVWQRARHQNGVKMPAQVEVEITDGKGPAWQARPEGDLPFVSRSWSVAVGEFLPPATSTSERRPSQLPRVAAEARRSRPGKGRPRLRVQIKFKSNQIKSDLQAGAGPQVPSVGDLGAQKEPAQHDKAGATVG